MEDDIRRQIIGAKLEGNASKIAQLDGLLSEIRAQLASDPDPINVRWFECQVVERALLETQRHNLTAMLRVLEDEAASSD